MARRPSRPYAEEAPPRHAQRASWTDPEDIRPDAKRVPRIILGWRRSDPLRRMLVHRASGITAAHITAADKLREAVDIATLGYSAVRPLIYVAHLHLPRTGMGPSDLARTRATRVVMRVSRLFTEPELQLLQAVVLGNVTLSAWCAVHTPAKSPRVEKRRLLRILDLLVEHFDAEVQDDLATGRRLPP